MLSVKNSQRLSEGESEDGGAVIRKIQLQQVLSLFFQIDKLIKHRPGDAQLRLFPAVKLYADFVFPAFGRMDDQVNF